jgi:hypothetical protein
LVKKLEIEVGEVGSGSSQENRCEGNTLTC